MFSFLEGVVVEKGSGTLILSVGGLGFSVVVPIGLWSEAKPGKKIFLWVRTFYREKEKDFVHYGFARREELELFNRLIKVPSVGPQVAISIISNLGVEGLEDAVGRRDLDALKRVPLVGPKTARRIITELGKDIAVETFNAKISAVFDALLSLGYTKKEAKEALSAIEVSRDDTEEQILKRVLKRLGGIE